MESGKLTKEQYQICEVERLILFLRLLIQIETVEKKKVIGMKFGWGKWKNSGRLLVQDGKKLVGDGKL